MTLMEWAELLGNFGEFLGAIAVVFTLGYLIVQVRQNTQAIRFHSGRESARLVSDLGVVMMQPNVVDSLTRLFGSEPEKVTDHDRLNLDNIGFSWLSALQQDFFEYQSGLQSDEWWESKKKPLANMFSSEAFRNWWATIGREYWTGNFQEVVNEMITATVPYSMTDRLRDALSPSSEQT